ncbi:nose resistant to fluoxetine protein 6 [Caerostris darwini]|uniref:Nose resistant to fluoxetine protein 6 n=1 Tax=Caerostris darwini TaxID=1538125 RepID=A0AAV4X689_9ARAC|nr:nose resistant to fluoxetine protein 6 [Caerostris darwini]
MMKITFILAILVLVFISIQCHVETNKQNVQKKIDQSPSNYDLARPDMHLYESFLKNFTNRAVKATLPILYQMLEKVNISTGCLSSLFKYAVSLKEIKVWAMKMFDATAKIPSGMFDGTVTEFGAFDQCLAILVKNKKGFEDFRGQYCSVEAVPTLGPRPKNLSLAKKSDTDYNGSIMKEIENKIFAFYQLTHRFGICVPSTCSADDMQMLGAQAGKPLNFGIRVSNCLVNEEIQVETVHIVILCIATLLVIFVCIGTVLESYLSRRKNEDGKTATPSLPQQILMAFSASYNAHKLFSFESKTSELKCLHGIRALSMTWVILGHTYIWINFQALTKSSVISTWFNNIEFEAILNGWLSVSSFIFLRLYPSVLLVLGVMFFLPWLASGPFWAELPGVEVANCRQFWWTNLLFINNWRPMSEMCMQHSWYISADMQLHIIAVFVLIALYRNAYVGFAMAFFLVLGGSLAVGIITYVNDYEPTILLSTINLKQMYRIIEDIHVKTFTYFGPYCIGIGIGYLILKHPKANLRLGAKLTGWLCACVLGLCSLYGTHSWNTGNFPSAEVTATYAALHRTAFIIALAWVTYMCITGKARTISRILEFSPFIIMSRLTFMTYLVQGPVIWTRYGSVKERIFYSHYNMLYEYIGNIVLSLSVAFVGHLLVEAPFANLERLLFSNSKQLYSKDSSNVLCRVETESHSENSQPVKPT